MSVPDTEEVLDPELSDGAAIAESERGEGEFARPSSKFWRWITKGGLAILDQGLISGSNFLIGILLARWLMPDPVRRVFGRVLGIPAALLCVPVVSVGAAGGVQRIDLQQVAARISENAPGHSPDAHRLRRGLAGGRGCDCGYFLGKAGGLPGALAGVAIASPCILFFWLHAPRFLHESCARRGRPWERSFISCW